MKFKFLSIAALALILTGCGGHDYEGDWKMQTDRNSSKMLKMMGSDGGFTLGDDFVEVNGQRVDMEIFVRESGAKSYLILKNAEGQEEAFEIVDENTIQKSAGFMTLKYKRA